MNKINVINLILKKISVENIDKQQSEIVKDIEIAKNQWEESRKIFDMVKDNDMIDYAIYLERARRIKYEYLLKEAKDKNININYYASIK